MDLVIEQGREVEVRDGDLLLRDERGDENLSAPVRGPGNPVRGSERKDRDKGPALRLEIRSASRRSGMQAVIYARVSRDDGTQNVENQLEPLTEWAKRLGATVVATEVDRASGKRGNARPALDRVRQLAHERRFDALLIAALDRLSRGGIETTAQLLRELDERGVVLQSLREPWLYQADPHIRGLLISIFAW